VTAAQAGWIVLGVACAAALVVMGAGAVAVYREQRALKSALTRIEETLRLRFDPGRFEAAMTRIRRDEQAARALLDRLQRATSTIGTAVRLVAVALRLVRLVR
jgi:hypothetical protein